MRKCHNQTECNPIKGTTCMACQDIKNSACIGNYCFCGDNRHPVNGQCREDSNKGEMERKKRSVFSWNVVWRAKSRVQFYGGVCIRCRMFKEQHEPIGPGGEDLPVLGGLHWNRRPLLRLKICIWLKNGGRSRVVQGSLIVGFKQ